MYTYVDKMMYICVHVSIHVFIITSVYNKSVLTCWACWTFLLWKTRAHHSTEYRLHHTTQVLTHPQHLGHCRSYPSYPYRDSGWPKLCWRYRQLILPIDFIFSIYVSQLQFLHTLTHPQTICRFKLARQFTVMMDNRASFTKVCSFKNRLWLLKCAWNLTKEELKK